MSRHTPGPWKAIKADLYDSEETDRWSVVTAAFEDCEYFVATIENGAPGDTLQTEGHNARLMAAAPQMLDALEGAMRIVDRWYPRIPEQPERDEEFKALAQMRRAFEQAIEAATGNGA